MPGRHHQPKQITCSGIAVVVGVETGFTGIDRFSTQTGRGLEHGVVHADVFGKIIHFINELPASFKVSRFAQIGRNVFARLKRLPPLCPQHLFGWIGTITIMTHTLQCDDFLIIIVWHIRSRRTDSHNKRDIYRAVQQRFHSSGSCAFIVAEGQHCVQVGIGGDCRTSGECYKLIPLLAGLQHLIQPGLAGRIWNCVRNIQRRRYVGNAGGGLNECVTDAVAQLRTACTSLFGVGVGDSPQHTVTLPLHRDGIGSVIAGALVDQLHISL